MTAVPPITCEISEPGHAERGYCVPAEEECPRVGRQRKCFIWPGIWRHFEKCRGGFLQGEDGKTKTHRASLWGGKNDNSPAARTCFYMTLRLNFKLIFSKQPVFVVKANLSINISNMKKL